MSAARWSLLKWIVPGASILCLIAFGIWLWCWRPSTPITSEKLIDTSLQDTVRNTQITRTFPNLSASSITLSVPQKKTPHLTARDIIASLYGAMGNKWYSGQVEMFYASVKGAPFGPKPQLVWVVVNHMPFPHSELALPKWRQHLMQFKHNLRVVLGMAQPLRASTYQFYDAVTGNPLGTLRQESGGF